MGRYVRLLSPAWGGPPSPGEIGVSPTRATPDPMTGRKEKRTYPGCPNERETHPRRPTGESGQVQRQGTSSTQKSSRHRRVERSRCPYNLILMAEEIRQNIGLPWQRPQIEVEVETLGRPQKVTGQREEEAGQCPTQLVDGSHNRLVVTRRTVTPPRMESNAKTSPSIQEERCGTTSLAPNTPWAQESSRRRAPNPT